MSVNDLRSLVTVLSMAVFIGIVAWAWSAANRRRFDEAALLPFAEGTSERTSEEMADESRKEHRGE